MSKTNDNINERPRISIVCPIWNVAPYIKQCIESILSQTYKNWEMIVMDGASTDGTLDIVRDYVAKNSNIRVYSKPDEGPWHAVDKGLQLARGEFLAIVCGQDGYHDKDWLLKCIEVFDRDKDVSLVWALGLGMTEDGKIFNTSASYAHFIEGRDRLKTLMILVSKFLNIINDLLFAGWERKKFLLSKIFSKAAPLRLHSITAPGFGEGEFPQKEKWLSYWLRTGLVFPDQSMVIAKEVFLECTQPYVAGSRTMGKMTDFYFNFASKGFLPYYLPTYATFGRIHANNSGSRNPGELHKEAKKYFNNVIEFGKDLKKKKEKFIFRGRDGNSIRERQFLK